MKRSLFDDPFRLLESSGTDLDTAVARRILALGPDAVPRLLAIAEREMTAENEWPQVHAVEMLIELGIEQTFDRLIQIYLRTGADDFNLWEVFIRRGSSLGKAFLDRMFDLLDKEPQHTFALVHLLYEFGRDRRIDALLDRLSETDPETVGMLLSACEDPARLPLLMKTVESLARAQSPYCAILDVADAIDQLGGELPEHVSFWVAQRRRAFDLKQRAHLAKLGFPMPEPSDDPSTLN